MKYCGICGGDIELNDEFATLITDEHPFDRVEDAFALAQGNGDFMKILVEMRGGRRV